VWTFPVSYLCPALTRHRLHRNLRVPQGGDAHRSVSSPWLLHHTRASGASNRAGNTSVLHLYFLTCVSEREHFFFVWLLMCLGFFFCCGKKCCPVISRFLALKILYSGCLVLFCFIFYIISRRLSSTTGCDLALHIILHDIMQGLEGSG